VSTLIAEQERDILAKSIEVLTALTGKRPRGWTAPAWATSKHSVKLLEEFGLVREHLPFHLSCLITDEFQLYDHSFMHHDSQMYYVPDGSEVWIETNTSKPAESWMKPMSALKPSSIVEIPASWHLDDWPPFQPKPAIGCGYVDVRVVEQQWRDQFEFLYEEYDEFIFPMSIHPQVSGKPQVVLMHRRMIEWINQHEGVEWCTFEEMAEEFEAGKIKGVEVIGGVDA